MNDLRVTIELTTRRPAATASGGLTLTDLWARYGIYRESGNPGEWRPTHQEMEDYSRTQDEAEAVGSILSRLQSAILREMMQAPALIGEIVVDLRIME